MIERTSSKQTDYGKVHGYLRLLAFFLTLLWVGLTMLVRRPKTVMARSLWRQQMCRLVARCIGMRIDVIGTVPEAGMIVANHLSYLDAVVLGAITPAVFVAKSEVRKWPLVGWLTAKGGTIYLQRENVRAATEVNRALSAVMVEQSPVVVFPEGTTTGATDPLPFHPALFEPAMRTKTAVWPAALAYTVDGRTECVPERVCYWGEMTFVPHLIGFLRLRRVRAVVRIAEEPVAAANRNEAAAMSHAVVSQMLGEGLVVPSGVPAGRGVLAQQTSLA